MAFKDLTLPDCYNLDVQVTRQVRSEDVTALSGDIYPNPKWAYSRRQFRVSWGPKKLEDVETFLSFWEVVKTEHTFRLRDEQDYRSAAPGQVIALSSTVSLILFWKLFSQLVTYPQEKRSIVDNIMRNY